MQGRKGGGQCGGKGACSHTCLPVQGFGARAVRVTADESFAVGFRSLPPFCSLFCLSSPPLGDLFHSRSKCWGCREASRSPDQPYLDNEPLGVHHPDLPRGLCLGDAFFLQGHDKEVGDAHGCLGGTTGRMFRHRETAAQRLPDAYPRSSLLPPYSQESQLRPCLETSKYGGPGIYNYHNVPALLPLLRTLEHLPSLMPSTHCSSATLTAESPWWHRPHRHLGKQTRDWRACSW